MSRMYAIVFRGSCEKYGGVFLRLYYVVVGRPIFPEFPDFWLIWISIFSNPAMSGQKFGVALHV